MASSRARLTEHAIKRIRTRLKLDRKRAQELADRALIYGISHADAKGRLNRYFDSLWFKHKDANNIRIYDRKVFIFINSLLITIYLLPDNLYNSADMLQAELEEKIDKKLNKIDGRDFDGSDKIE